jgi:hypothetical protein
MLTNVQVEALAERMGVPLEPVVFKSELKDMVLKYNKSYIINLEDEFDEEGQKNAGSHYVCFQVNNYLDKPDEYVYFDSYGCAPPNEVIEFCKVKAMPYSEIDIQSIMADFCGWACLAFLHFINAWEGRSRNLYNDAEHFTSLFKDLNKETDHKYNEFVIRQFFKPPSGKKTTMEDLGFEFLPDKNIAVGIADVNSIDSKN